MESLQHVKERQFMEIDVGGVRVRLVGGLGRRVGASFFAAGKPAR
jgi:hypothetical protein